MLVSGETTFEQRVVIKNNPFRLKDWRKRSNTSSDGSSSLNDGFQQREHVDGEVKTGTEKENEISDVERGGVLTTSASTGPPRPKDGSWLPLDVFGSKSSLDRFGSDTDNESGVDPEFRGGMRRALVVHSR